MLFLAPNFSLHEDTAEIQSTRHTPGDFGGESRTGAPTNLFPLSLNGLYRCALCLSLFFVPSVLHANCFFRCDIAICMVERAGTNQHEKKDAAAREESKGCCRWLGGRALSKVPGDSSLGHTLFVTSRSQLWFFFTPLHVVRRKCPATLLVTGKTMPTSETSSEGTQLNAW